MEAGATVPVMLSLSVRALLYGVAAAALAGLVLLVRLAAIAGLQLGVGARLRCT